jgi:lipooligosaccharide transport system permease protein
MRFALPMSRVSYRAIRVWQRDLDTFLRLWKTESWWPTVEPLLYISALGFGLGLYVRGLDNNLSFIQFIAPAFVATTVMFAASFECMFASFVRMEYQRTFDGILATPLNIEEVIAGEILWGTTRGLIAAASVLLVISVLGLVHTPWALMTLVVALVEGFMFASMAMIVTALVPAIDVFNYYITLGITPMFLLSGVFFPLTRLPELAQALTWASPLTHAVQVQRSLVLGQLSWDLVWNVLWMGILGLIAFNVALALMRRRLIK